MTEIVILYKCIGNGVATGTVTMGTAFVCLSLMLELKPLGVLSSVKVLL